MLSSRVVEPLDVIENIVINLADSPLSIKQVADALAQNPVAGLNKVYLMKDGGIKIIEVAK